MTKESRSGFALAIAACLIGGCASANGDMAESPDPNGPATTVEVTNHNWQDVVVYAVHPTRRVRLGMVVSMATARFTVPRTAMGTESSLRLVADPIGSNRPFRTDVILVNPGARIVLNVENSLALSNYAVRSGR